MTLDQTLIALADPTRRGVIDLLRSKPRRASDLAESLDASRPAMSKHLRVLRVSGLVETSVEDDARVRLYSLRREQFGELREWLDQVERFWGEQLAGFAAHITSTAPGGARRK
ncbi:metalloregulator ArsR/SmtB family transcription factor [soil metagenome]